MKLSNTKITCTLCVNSTLLHFISLIQRVSPFQASDDVTIVKEFDSF